MKSPVDLRKRTREFSLSVIQFHSRLPRETSAQILGRQLLRSATSVGAQYREAARAKSAADFISKSEGILQELDETAYWFELIEGARFGNPEAIARLRGETNELIAILVTIVKKLKRNRTRH